MRYSLIIPVYNRPDHIQSLLECLVNQDFKNFEVVIVEDGSTINAQAVVDNFARDLDIMYLYKKNSGQGFSRNYGMERATGDYFVILDSDILLDNDFMSRLDKNLKTHYADAYGGPDKLHPHATPTQKAIDYVMTAFLTTGGTRGGSKQVGKWYPRSFNMGVSRTVFERTKGFKIPFMGEDIEFSKRIMAEGYKIAFFEDVFVYHDRKNSLHKFYEQIKFFGRARVNIFKFYPDTLKPLHFIPLAFMSYIILLLIAFILNPVISMIMAMPLFLYLLLIFFDSLRIHKNPVISVKSVLAALAIMSSYSEGFVQEYWKQFVLKKEAY